MILDAASRYSPVLERASTKQHGWVAEMEQASDGQWTHFTIALELSARIAQLEAELRLARSYVDMNGGGWRSKR